MQTLSEQTIFILESIKRHSEKIFIGKKGVSHFDSYMPFVALVMLERLNYSITGILMIMRHGKNYPGTNYCVKILFRPVILDLIYFSQSANIRSKGKATGISDKKIQNEMEEYFERLLSDGLKQTLNHIKYYEEKEFLNASTAELYRKGFRDDFESFFDSKKIEPTLKNGKKIELKDILDDMLTFNPDFRFILHTYDDYQMALSKIEHFGIISYTLNRLDRNYDFNAIFNFSYDCFRHLSILYRFLMAYHEEVNLSPDILSEIDKDATEILQNMDKMGSH